jgi:S-adenosylmethionine hydrolase
MQPLVTFISDFGRDDWFVGVVHGVILATCPAARIVDLAHHIPPGDIERAAFVVEVATPDFGPGTVHLVVVDPGVGTGRRALAVRARDQLFVGPDNGVLEWALSAPGAEIRELTDVKLFRHPVSRTFHGRDVFAPVAAHLAGGIEFSTLGPIANDPLRLPVSTPKVVNGELQGRIMFVDRFGNLLTNLTERHLAERFPDVPPDRLEVEAAGWVIQGLARAYADAPVGATVAILDSSGRLEIAQVRGDASQRLGLSVRDDVRVRVRR